MIGAILEEVKHDSLIGAILEEVSLLGGRGARENILREYSKKE